MPEKAARIRSILKESARLTNDCPATRYLRRRCPGIDPTNLPDLRYHPSMWHGPSRTYHPALLGIVRDSEGAGITVHRTFLSVGSAGVTKAKVEPARMVMPGAKPLKGGAIRLLPAAGGRLGIAEGIETALSASVLHCYPVWSVISANGIRSFVPPPGITELVIFADHDDAGLTAAFECVARTGAYIQHPEEFKSDWNDVHLAEWSKA